MASTEVREISRWKDNKHCRTFRARLADKDEKAVTKPPYSDVPPLHQVVIISTDVIGRKTFRTRHVSDRQLQIA